MYSTESRRHSAINVYFIYELMAQLSVTYHLCPSSLLGLAGPQGSWLWLKCKRTGSPCKHNSWWLLISHWLKQHSHGPMSICVCAGLQYYVAKACYREGWRSSQSFTLHILLMWKQLLSIRFHLPLCRWLSPISFLTPQGLVLCLAHFRWWYGSGWLNEWMSFFFISLTIPSPRNWDQRVQITRLLGGLHQIWC